MSKSFEDIFAETNSIQIVPDWTADDRKIFAAEITRQYEKGFADGEKSAEERIIKLLEEDPDNNYYSLRLIKGENK